MNYNELVNNQSDKLIEKLLTEIRSKKNVDVRFEFIDDEQWSMVSVHVDEEDNELALRLLPDNNYQLYFGYYDADDEFQEIIKPLTGEEKLLIPKSLHKVMTKVLTDEEGLRVPGGLLTKS